jgi:hypothetical protein
VNDPPPKGSGFDSHISYKKESWIDLKKRKLTKKVLILNDVSSAFIVIGLLPVSIAVISAYFIIRLIERNAVFAIALAIVFMICITIVIQMCRELYYFLQKKMNIWCDRFVIFEDVIERKGTKNSTAVYFKQYYQKAAHPIYLSLTNFQEAKVGDRYFLVKLDDEDEVLYIYPSARYQLDDKLKDRKAKISEAYQKCK